MRLAGLSVERLRWGLLAGSLLLVGVLVVLVSYGRYRAVQTLKDIVKRSGATISHEADGITWSQALGKKQIFTLHAKHVVPHGGGKYTLQDGMLELYGPDGKVADRISGAQFEYDETQGVAHAAGVVDIEIELPKGLAAGAGANSSAKATAPQAIHVRTSGLTYVKKLGVAATDQEVEIEYAGMHGWAKGAEFDTGQSVVHLLADVKAEGTLRGAGRNEAGTPATLTAAKADLDRDADRIDLTEPRVASGGRTGSAAAAVLHLRRDGSLEVVEASGGVTLKQDTRTITAATLRAAMNERSQMQRADLGGGVALLDTNAERPTHAIARTAKITCDEAGYPTSAVMDGAVALTMEERRPGGVALARQMGAEHVTLTMERVARPGHGSRVSGVQAQGGAWARGNSVVQASAERAGGLKLTSVAGDELQLALVQDAQGKDRPQSMSGKGNTRIEQRMPDGTVQTGTGDVLEASFAPAGTGRGLEIASAEQTGHVAIRSVPGKQGVEPSEGTAEKAQLDGASDVITLSGRPRLTRGDTSVTADVVRMMQQTGDAVASGNVAATFVNASAKAGSGSGSGSAVTHALAQEATLHRTAQTMELKGTDAAPARMWQGASQVEAANLFLDRGKDSLQAWPAAPTGVVRSVFASAGNAVTTTAKSQKGEGAPRGERVVRVSSARLDYSGSSHQAVFSGGVTAQGEDGQVRAQRGVAFLTPKESATDAGHGGKSAAAKGQPDPVASSVEKIVMSGAVRVEQPGRTATGDQLLYTAATGEFVLTGTPSHPPHVVDDKQGNITGATLLFRSADSTIVVEGTSPGLPGSHRVHTETTIKK